jgi:hypothetical protein
VFEFFPNETEIKLLGWMTYSCETTDKQVSSFKKLENIWCPKQLN